MATISSSRTLTFVVPRLLVIIRAIGSRVVVVAEECTTRTSSRVEDISILTTIRTYRTVQAAVCMHLRQVAVADVSVAAKILESTRCRVHDPRRHTPRPGAKSCVLLWADRVETSSVNGPKMSIEVTKGKVYILHSSLIV